MKFIQGINRNQTYLFPVSLDESIDQDNVVRAVDSFVESLPLKMIGFKVDFVENGRPAEVERCAVEILISQLPQPPYLIIFSPFTFAL